MPDPLAGFNYSTPAYPYTTGYAQLSDVQARISAGSWDPTDPTAYPTSSMVNSWLQDATANIDAALATRGYSVPLTPIANWTPPAGMQVYQGIALQAWLMLRSIAAAYAAHYVEAARHGGAGAELNEDPNASHWMEIFDDFMTRVETGADNLTAFGVGGLFVPDIDPAKAMSTGSLGTVLADPSLQEGPMFTKSGDLGGGWETTTPGAPPSGPPFS